MKAVVQRVSRASVRVSGETVGEIGPGLAVLLEVAEGDTEEDAEYLASKIINLRIFSEAEGKFNLSLKDLCREMLVVSQFTLIADTRKGRRPSFIEATQPQEADGLYNVFIRLCREEGTQVATGQFGAMMMLEIYNDGPVTIILDSRDRLNPRL
ncbi:D-aminoacyl-tRNA deacylase [Dehalococcoides mccartyi]|nr:D-aminoacyl-tRNA deacylase [Dehalococcoides mccartyi]